MTKGKIINGLPIKGIIVPVIARCKATKQSFSDAYVRLPRSLRSLAMTAKGVFEQPVNGINVFLIFLSLSHVAFLHADVPPRPESARAFGMGNAFCAVANDYNSMMFNPAGLSAINQIEVSGVAGRFFTGNAPPLNELHAAGAMPMKVLNNAWDFGTVGSLLHRTTRKDDSSVTNFGIYWGGNPSRVIPKGLIPFNLPEGLQAGIALRARQITSLSPAARPSGFGGGVDAGFLYKIKDGDTPLTQNWTAGLAVQEINSSGISTPVSYRMGAAWKNPQSTLALDLVMENGEANFFPGIEVSFFKRLLMLRAGSGYLPGEARQLTFGMGVFLPPVQVDIAYGFPLGNPFQANDRALVSVTYRFGTPLLDQYLNPERTEKENELRARISSLQFEKDTLENSLREERALFEKVEKSLVEAKNKNAETEKNIKAAEEKLLDQKNSSAKLGLDIQQLEIKRKQMDEKIVELNLEIKDFEVRPPFAPGRPRIHRVGAGETLRGISKKYYGDPNLWKAIYDANQDKMIKGTPKEGETLKIP